MGGERLVTGYTRFWNCDTCGRRCETVDHPRVQECDVCEARRKRGELDEILRPFIGRTVTGYALRDQERVALRFGEDAVFGEAVISSATWLDVEIRGVRRAG